MLLRRLLFYFFAVLFVAVSTILTLYTIGWQVDLRECDWRHPLDCPIQKTGAMFIETDPRGVEIEINGRNYADTSSLIESGTLIRNLEPGPHRLRITKAGYQPWEKNLEVASGRVTEALNVLLISQTLSAEPLPLPALRGQSIAAINSRGDKFVLQNDSTRTFYLYDLNDPQTILNLSLVARNLTQGDIRKITFNPLDDPTLITETTKGLYLIDLRRTQASIITTNLPFWDIDGGTIYYTTSTPSLIRRFNLVTKTHTNESWRAASTTITTLRASGSRRAVLTKTKDLFLGSDGVPELINNHVEFFSFSPDGRKLAYVRDKQIHIYLMDDLIRLGKRAGETISLDLSGDFSSLAWYDDSAHLLAIYGGNQSYRVELVEIDNRDAVNRYDLINGAASAYYDAGLRRLFLTQNNRLLFLPIQ